MKREVLYIVALSVFAFLATNAFADVTLNQGSSQSTVHVENNTQGNSTTYTHVETNVNGNDRVYDSNQSGSVTIQNNGNSYSVETQTSETPSPFVSATPTPTATATPTMIPTSTPKQQKQSFFVQLYISFWIHVKHFFGLS